VAGQHGRGLRLARFRDRDARVLTRGDDATILEDCHGVDRAVVKAQHLLGGVAFQRPANGGRVEAAGHGSGAVRRNRERPHRPAMAAQLCLRGRRCRHE